MIDVKQLGLSCGICSLILDYGTDSGLLTSRNFASFPYTWYSDQERRVNGLVLLSLKRRVTTTECRRNHVIRLMHILLLEHCTDYYWFSDNKLALLDYLFDLLWVEDSLPESGHVSTCVNIFDNVELSYYSIGNEFFESPTNVCYILIYDLSFFRFLTERKDQVVEVIALLLAQITYEASLESGLWHRAKL